MQKENLIEEKGIAISGESKSNGKKDLLKGLTFPELKNYFVGKGHRGFRGAQIFHWIYNRLVDDFYLMNNLPKEIRQELADTCELKTLKYVTSEVSPSSGTKKYIFETSEGNLIESVIIPEEVTELEESEFDRNKIKEPRKRTTLCISTQVGCPLDCQFCATGLMGYKKNLTPGEIFDQYSLAANDYGKDKITNIVYMGMGEPLLNFDATVKSLQIFADELTKGISLKKITVSTAGIAPRIIDLADTALKVKIALSLHSCFDEIRDVIMPINKKYSLKQNIDAVRYYARKTGTRITFEYIMLKDINDRNEDLNALKRLCSEIPSKVNVIPFNSLEHMNPTGFSAQLKSSPKERIEKFVEELRNRNVTVTIRFTQGDDIAAACGQLALPLTKGTKS
jgi:23S rRNA (adenine2503-C2)-methyltransferase